VAISPASGDAGEFAARLRGRALPIVGRVEEGRLLLDLRTVPPEQDSALADSVAADWLATRK
jgi:L-seryl-tRNA(Ser) seleniumtransferase